MKKLLLFVGFLLLAGTGDILQAQITSNLPIVIVTTPTAISTSQIQGTLSIVDNSSGINNQTDPPTFTGMIGIRIRGASTTPKLSYSLETWVSNGVSLDTALLGMASDNDWVLLSSYNDRSLARTVLTNRLHENMSRYAPRMEHCELIVNGAYQGVYLFGEKIKRTAGRLDLSKLNVTDNSGSQLTGGYIWRLDDGTPLWTSSFPPPYATTQQINFIIDYPDAADITPAQTNYIKAYVDSFENAMNASNFQDTLLGWRRFGAVNGFSDFIILNELAHNYDAYRNNYYMYKDRDKKLRPGPVWGFDLAWYNTTDCNASKDTGWCYNVGAVCGTLGKLPPFWWSKLTTDTAFMRNLKCEYKTYRMPGNILDTTKIFYVLDSVRTRLNANGALTRNFTQWPIWGVNLNNEPTPMASNYNEEIDALKQYIKKRLSWLDAQWAISNCPWPLGTENVSIENSFSVYPNPAGSEIQILHLNGHPEEWNYAVMDLQGRSCIQGVSKEQRQQVRLSGLKPGFYLLRIQQNGQSHTVKLYHE